MNLSYKLWECLVEYKNILLSCNYTGMIIIIMGDEMAVDPALCLAIGTGAVVF